MTNLYKITEQHRELQKLADDEELPAEAIADTFQAIEGEFNDKAVSVVHVIKNMDSDVAAVEAEIKRLGERKKALSNRQESIREYLRSNMEASGITKIECPLFSITLAKGRDIAFIDDEEKLPDDLVSVSVVQKPDKNEILKRLKAGDNVPGARIEKSKSSLRIK
tara:strand:+ start:177 stop:671 length:495 start_codon:yes stop_codon:yes gene_type:complete